MNDKARERHEKELLRLDSLSIYEKKYFAEGYTHIGGMDEAGRGPLAGPVAAAAVILPHDCKIPYINDSKKLSEKKRNELEIIIKEQAVAYSVAMVDNQTIDKINILQATYEAMRQAVAALSVQPDFLLVDFAQPTGITIPLLPIVKGDSKSISIAAASILAKVARDKLMLVYDEIYPEYGFAQHKGYGTAIHMAAIQEHGPTPIHRSSFLTGVWK